MFQVKMMRMLIHFLRWRLQQRSSAKVVVTTVTISFGQDAHATGITAAFAPTPFFIGITVL